MNTTDLDGAAVNVLTRRVVDLNRELEHERATARLWADVATRERVRRLSRRMRWAERCGWIAFGALLAGLGVWIGGGW